MPSSGNAVRRAAVARSLSSDVVHASTIARCFRIPIIKDEFPSEAVTVFGFRDSSRTGTQLSASAYV